MFARNRPFAFATTLAIALTATAAIAQNRGQSRPVHAARPFGVNRGGLGVSGGHVSRPSNRPSPQRGTFRAGQSLGGRNLGAVRPSNGNSNQPRRNNWNSPRQGSGNSFGHNSGNSTGNRNGNSFGHNSGNRSGQHNGSSFGHNSGNWTGQHNGNSFGHTNGINQPRHNNWYSPRSVGRINGFNVRSGTLCPPKNYNSIIGFGPGFRYSNSYCGNSFGYPYYGGYPYSDCYYGGGSSWRYPLYTYSGYGTYGGIAFDTYAEGDVFDSLSTDVEVTGQEIAEAEAAAREMQAQREAAMQSNALDEFGQRHAESPAPSVTGMTPEAQTAAREIGDALGRGDRAFEAGNYDNARDEYVRAVVLAGEDAGVRIALGLAEYALGSYTDASVAVRRGAARSPGLASSDFDLRSVYGKQGDFEAHRHMLEVHAAANPSDADAQFLLGFVQFFSGQRDEGRKTLDAYLGNLAHDDSVREFIETAKVAMPR